MQVQSTRILPTTTFGESVKLNFSEISSPNHVTAVFIKSTGQQQITHQNLPENIRVINSTINFIDLLKNQYARIEMTGGTPKLFVAPQTDQLKDLLLANEILILIGVGKEQLQQATIKDNGVLLFGKTGTGKSLLGNLLANRPIVAIKKGLKYLFEAQNSIFPVSHSNVESCTGCPNLHSPNNKNFTYIDFPGFDDTRGAVQDITNAFFRAEVIKRVQQMKGVLLISYNDISVRNREIQDTFNELFQFFGFTNQTNQASLEMLARSFSVVITKVPAGNSTNEEIRADIVTHLNGFIQSASSLPGNIKMFLTTIINESRWDYFCEPTALGVSQSAENDKVRLTNLIDNRAVYIRKQNTPIEIKVNPRHIADVQRALLAMIDRAKSVLSSGKMSESVLSTLKAEYVKGEDALRNCLTSLDAIATSNQCLSLTETLQLGTGNGAGASFFSAELLDEARKFDEVMKFLYELLPDDIARAIPIKRNWISELNCRETLTNYRAIVNGILAPATIVAENGRLSLRGHFPKISQISAIIGNYQFNELEIHALHTLTFDNDLSSPHLRKKLLTIIAHTCKIRREQQINLSGNDASPIQGAASDGQGLGGDGAHGVPGRPGGNGGHFYSLINFVEGLNIFSVVTNGGNGGRGQNGGNGQPGRNGNDAEALQSFAGAYEEYMNPNVHCTDRWNEVAALCNHGDGTFDRTLTKYGSPGGWGGHGGMGGKGGLGGYAGKIKFYCFSNPQLTINSTIVNGAPGADGTPGQGNQGGKRGRDWTGVWHAGRNPQWGWNGWHLPHYVDSGVRSRSGDTPTQRNEAGRASPTPQGDIDRLVNKDIVIYSMVSVMPLQQSF